MWKKASTSFPPLPIDELLERRYERFLQVLKSEYKTRKLRPFRYE